MNKMFLFTVAVLPFLHASFGYAADLEYVQVPQHEPQVIYGPPPVQPNRSYRPVEDQPQVVHNQVIINNNIVINNPPVPAPTYIGRPYPRYNHPVPLYEARPYQYYAPRYVDGAIPSNGEWDAY